MLLDIPPIWLHMPYLSWNKFFSTLICTKIIDLSTGNFHILLYYFCKHIDFSHLFFCHILETPVGSSADYAGMEAAVEEDLAVHVE
jgi:hypothetical protein